MDQSRVSRNDPCPCGSGKKYKHCCLPKEVEAARPDRSPTITDLHGKPKKRPEYPIGTVALYGPDDKTTTKIAAGVITSPTAEPIIRAVGGDRRDDEPEGPAGDEGVLRRARGQVGGDQRGEHGMPARGGRRFPRRDGLPLLPVLGGQAGEQPPGLRMRRSRSGGCDDSRGQTIRVGITSR